MLCRYGYDCACCSFARCIHNYRYQWEKRLVLVGWRYDHHKGQLSSFKILLVLNTLIHRKQYVELFFRPVEQLSVLYTSPSAFRNGHYVNASLHEAPLELARDVFIEKNRHAARGG